MFNDYKAVPWGDIFELSVISFAFFYWAAAVPNFPLPVKEKLPKFMLNRKILLGLGLLSGALAVSQFF